MRARARALASRWRCDRRGEDDRAEPRAAERRVSHNRVRVRARRWRQWSRAGVIYRFPLFPSSSPSPPPSPPSPSPSYSGAVLCEDPVSASRTARRDRSFTLGAWKTQQNARSCRGRTTRTTPGLDVITKATPRAARPPLLVVHASSSGMPAR